MNTTITILCVDDEPINLMIFERNFKKRFSVFTAESGFDGLKLLQAHPETNIVITDMKMPGMDGLEFVERAKSEFPNIIFFILTGFEITDDIRDALNAQKINRYFRKPYSVKEIDEAITQLLNR